MGEERGVSYMEQAKNKPSPTFAIVGDDRSLKGESNNQVMLQLSLLSLLAGVSRAMGRLDC